jgi:hypothetical protein
MNNNIINRIFFPYIAKIKFFAIKKQNEEDIQIETEVLIPVDVRFRYNSGKIIIIMHKLKDKNIDKSCEIQVQSTKYQFIKPLKPYLIVENFGVLNIFCKIPANKNNKEVL